MVSSLARGLDDDRLEAALQGAVLLDVLAVLVERGGADALDLAAGQGRLEHVGGVDGALGPAGADQRVQLVDEQDDVAARRTSFMTALMRSSNWPRYLVPATIMARSSTTIRRSARISGTCLVDDLLGQALDDGRLADAGLAEQHRVVLGAAAEDLDDAARSRWLRPMTGSSLPLRPVRSGRGRNCPGPASCSCPWGLAGLGSGGVLGASSSRRRRRAG
jgi:hypothetical protein